MQQSQGSPIRVGQSVGGATQDLAVIWAQLAQISTIELVKVITVNGDRLVVQPLLFKVDADNNSVKRGLISNVPFIKMQGGGNALTIDPRKGDIGVCGYASRDISLLKRIKDFVAPNSKRMYDVSDAIYLGSILNGDPSQYIEFLDNGINIKSTGDININGLTIRVDGTLVTKDGVVVDGHDHAQGNDSAGNSEQDTGPMK